MVFAIALQPQPLSQNKPNLLKPFWHCKLELDWPKSHEQRRIACEAHMISGTEMFALSVDSVSYPAACSFAKSIPQAFRPAP